MFLVFLINYILWFLSILTLCCHTLILILQIKRNSYHMKQIKRLSCNLLHHFRNIISFWNDVCWYRTQKIILIKVISKTYLNDSLLTSELKSTLCPYKLVTFRFKVIGLRFLSQISDKCLKKEPKSENNLPAQPGKWQHCPGNNSFLLQKRWL